MRAFGLEAVVALLGGVATAWANCEHANFVAPARGVVRSSLKDRGLHVLTPTNLTIRTHLYPQFPLKPRDARYGTPSWVLLDELDEGQLYEARACYASIQPTSVRLDAYEPKAVLETAELFETLVLQLRDRYPELEREAGVTIEEWLRDAIGGKQASEADEATAATAAGVSPESSLLLLRVLAAADYYTDNKTLMAEVPPTYVDLILDPLVLGGLPSSVLPTITYLFAVGFFAFWLAICIATGVQRISLPEQDASKKTN